MNNEAKNQKKSECECYFNGKGSQICDEHNPQPEAKECEACKHKNYCNCQVDHSHICGRSDVEASQPQADEWWEKELNEKWHFKKWREIVNNIVLGDCIDGMKKIPDKSIDLIFADPPYNAKDIGPNKRVYKGQKMQLGDEEYRLWCEKWFAEAERIAKRVLLTPGIANTHNYPQPKWILCWHKPAAVSFNRMGGFNVWEPVFFYGEGMPKGKRLPQDYMLCNTRNLGNPIERNHPCPKPLELLRKLVDTFSLENEIVLDHFMGSGTTARACKDLKRNFIGFELIKDYVEISEKRIQQEILF